MQTGPALVRRPADREKLFQASVASAVVATREVLMKYKNATKSGMIQLGGK